MSVNFISSGQKTFVERLPDGLRVTKLAAKLYSLEYNKDEGFFLLEIADRYTLPEKTYGNYDKLSERVINTHHNKPGNTGILLTGLKGTGKSLFIKFVSNAMIDINIPVIQINKAFSGSDIFNFIEDIGSCVLVFDEFGKNYKKYEVSGSPANSPSQPGLLSLLDGLGNSKRLHLFTENDINSISEYLVNRPGRIHYHFRYSRLSDEVIVEYCKDLGVPDNVIEELLDLSTKLKVLSFDVVSCLIKEWFMYKGKLIDHLNILNISTRNDPANSDIKIISLIDKDGKSVDIDKIKVDFRDNNYLYITINQGDLNEYLDPINVDSAISVKNNIYKFICMDGYELDVLIKNVRY